MLAGLVLGAGLVTTRSIAQSPEILWADRRIYIGPSGIKSDLWMLPLKDGRIVISTPTSVQTWTRDGRLLKALGNRQQLRPTLGESTSPDGRTHVMTSLDMQSLLLIDAATGMSTARAELTVRSAPPRTHFTPDGSMVLLFDGASISALRRSDLGTVWSVTAGAAGAARFSHDGRSFVYTDDGVVTSRSTTTGLIVRRYPGVIGDLGVAFGDSSRFVLAYTGCVIYRWNATTGALLDTTRDRASCPLHEMVSDPAGRYVVTYGQWGRDGDSTVRIWLPGTMARIRDYGPSSIVSGIATMAITPDGSELIALTKYGVVVPIDLMSGEVGMIFPRAWTPYTTAPVSGSGGTIAVAGALAHLYDTNGAYLHTIGPQRNNLLNPLTASRDGTRFAALDWDHRQVWVFDTAGAVVAHFANGLSVTAAALSPDGESIVIVDSVVSLYSVATKARIATLVGPRQVATALAFSADGRRVAAGYESGSFVLWDATTHLEIRRHRPGTSRVLDIALGADGSRVFMLHPNRALTISSVEDSTGTSHKLVGDSIVSLAVSTDGRVLVVGGDSVYLYSLPTVTRIGTFADSLDVIRQAYRVGLIPGVAGVVTSSTDGDLIRWDGTGILRTLGTEAPRDRQTQGIATSVSGPTLVVSGKAVGDAIRIELFDLLGRRVRSVARPSEGSDHVSIDLSGIAAGVYVVSVGDGSTWRSSIIAYRP